MSFILEALRKSESERQRVTNATIADLPAGRKNRSQPWWVIALALLLLVNLVVLVVVLLRDRSAPAKQDLNVSQANVTASSTASSTLGQGSLGQGSLGQGNASQNNNRAPEYRPDSQQRVTGQSNYTVLPPANSASPATPLAQEAAPAPHVTYESVPRTEMELANAGASVPEGPTLVRPIDPNANSNAGVAPAIPAGRTTSLQDIHIDLHVFSQNRRDSFVLINMRRYTEGQRILEGALLEQITPEGVVLNYNGSRYQLNRN